MPLHYNVLVVYTCTCTGMCTTTCTLASSNSSHTSHSLHWHRVGNIWWVYIATVSGVTVWWHHWLPLTMRVEDQCVPNSPSYKQKYTWWNRRETHQIITYVNSFRSDGNRHNGRTAYISEIAVRCETILIWHWTLTLYPPSQFGTAHSPPQSECCCRCLLSQWVHTSGSQSERHFAFSPHSPHLLSSPCSH